jgi:hypothetical protein
MRKFLFYLQYLNTKFTQFTLFTQLCHQTTVNLFYLSYLLLKRENSFRKILHERLILGSLELFMVSCTGTIWQTCSLLSLLSSGMKTPTIL